MADPAAVEDLRIPIAGILSGDAKTLKFEEIYRRVFAVVAANRGETVFKMLQQCVQDHLKTVLVRVTADLRLETFALEWDRFKRSVDALQHVFQSLDQHYCSLLRLPSIRQSAFTLFISVIVRAESVYRALSTALLGHIERERNTNEKLSRNVFLYTLSILVVLDRSDKLYNDIFSDPFLIASRQHYKQIAAKSLKGEMMAFVKSADSWFVKEMSLMKPYRLHTKEKLQEILNEEIIKFALEQIVNNPETGVISMINSDLYTEMSHVYRLLARDPEGHNRLRAAMREHVRTLGNAIISKEHKPMQFISEVLTLRAKIDRFLHRALDNDKAFMRTFAESMEKVVSEDSRVPQSLAFYFDDLLKSETKMTAAEFSHRISLVMEIFPYQRDKEIFEEIYRRQLALRLLAGNANLTHERKVVEAIQVECGPQYVFRFLSLFRDVEKSRVIRRNFIRYRRKADLAVLVLTSNLWPIVPSPVCTLPSQAASSYSAFVVFYQQLHQHRRLMLQTSLGSAELNLQFEAGPKSLLVHTYQMCILMLFNEKDIFTYGEIKNKTKIPVKELERHILSLAHPRVRVLNKLPNTTTLADDHKFSYNTKYTSKLSKVKIPLIRVEGKPGGGGGGGGGGAEDAIVERRKNMVELAVIRIMKTQKTLTHDELASQITKQLSSEFTVHAAYINNVVQSLIARECITVDKADKHKYTYV